MKSEAKLSSDTAWRAGVYRLCGMAPDGPRGTAFGLGPRLALTCHHCVDGVDPQSLVLKPSTSEGTPLLRVAEVLFPGDPQRNDVAILRMADDLPTWLPASSHEPPETAKLRGYGFPGLNPKQALVRIDVESRGLQPAEYAQRYRLDCALILAREPAARGMSGGPIIEAESGAVVAMIVGGPDFDGRAIALPLWVISSVERPWNAFDQAIVWSVASTEQASWALNGRAATVLCKTQVSEAVGRLTRENKFDAARYVSRPAFEQAVVGFLSGTKSGLLLTGASNVGKTSALASLAASMAGRALLFDGFQIDRLRQHLIDHVHEQLTKLFSGINSETVPALCQALREKNDGELVILVDGLNEAGASPRELRAWLSEATVQAKQLGCRIIMTCRSDYASFAEIDESQIDVFDLGIFSEREANAASVAYGIERLGAGVIEHHPLMFRIAAHSRNPNNVFQQGRHRAIRSFVKDLVAGCSGVTLGEGQVDSIFQGCKRVADHDGSDDDGVDIDFASNQLGGLQRLESLIEGGVFKAQGNRVRFSFDEFAAGLRSPLEADRMELAVLWRRSLKDLRVANQVANSLVACEARGEERRLSDHVESLLAALADSARDEMDSVYLCQARGGIALILCTLTEALPSTRTDITERIMSGFREALVESAHFNSFNGLYSEIELQAATLQIPWKQKAELLVQLLPLLSDFGLRTKDLLDRGGHLSVKADAEDPITVVGALARLILDHAGGMRELLLPHLDDDRRLVRDNSPSGEVSVGELICSLLLITASVDPIGLIELLITRPDSRAASALLRNVAAAHPDLAMDWAANHLDRASTINLVKDIITNSLRSVGPGRAPRELLGKLRTIACEATPDTRLIAASLIRMCEPEDLEAWDILAHAAALGHTSQSLRPVPGTRRQEFMQVLRARFDRYAVDEMESEDDAQLQEPMVGLAMDMLSRSTFADRLGYLAETKAYRLDKHAAFAPWLEYILRVAGHANSDLKQPLVYLVHFRWDRPGWPEQLWSALVGGLADSTFVCQLVIRVVEEHHETAPSQLMNLLRIAMKTRPKEALNALSMVAWKARRMSEVYNKPPDKLNSLLGLVANYLHSDPVASWPTALHNCESGEALQQFASLHASDDE